MYPHVYETNPATRFYGKITRQYTVQLPYWFRVAEKAVCRSHSTVRQSNHIITANFRVHASVTFLTNGDERPFLMVAFLNVWKRLLFTGDGFSGARSIDSAMLFLDFETFLQMAPWFQRSIHLAALWMRCSLWETPEKLLLLCVFHAGTEHFRKQICIFLSFAHAQCVQKWLQ